MTNDFITTTSLTIAKNFTFKDERLARATEAISAIYTNAVKYADAKNREIASILSTIKIEQSYKADGFDSVADYASKIFGIKRQNAYSLAVAGDIYNSSEASEKVKAFSPSKLAEVASVGIEKLNEDVESGLISAGTTQKDLRNYSKFNSPKQEKTTVLDKLTARAVSYTMNLPDELNEILSQKMTAPEWDEVISGYINSNGRFNCDVVKLPKGPALVAGNLTEKRTVDRKLYITYDFSLAVEFYTVKTEPSVKLEKKPKYSREELEAMLAALEEVEEPDENEDQ